MKSKLIFIFYLILCVFLVNSLPLIETSDKTNDLNSTSLILLATAQPKVHTNNEKNEILAPERVASKGDCDHTRQTLIYTEHFILNSDQLSQVSAVIKIQMSGGTNITCVELFDMKRAIDRPRLLDGGPGDDWVEVGINPEYGDGFYFTVKIYGYYF